jgi:hypothetical protein
VIAQVKDHIDQKRKHTVGKKAATATPLVVAATPLVVAAMATPLVAAATAAKTTNRRAPKRNAVLMAEAAVARVAPKRRKAAARATKNKAACGSDSDWTA